MIAIRKVTDATRFRKDLHKAKRKQGRLGIMPASAVSYFNRIDIGIYICILEICLQNKGISFGREIFPDAGGEEEFTKVAIYKL